MLARRARDPPAKRSQPLNAQPTVGLGEHIGDLQEPSKAICTATTIGRVR
jgi:hypothetical protein